MNAGDKLQGERLVTLKNPESESLMHAGITVRCVYDDIEGATTRQIHPL
jgi:hypothetical protein